MYLEKINSPSDIKNQGGSINHLSLFADGNRSLG